MGEAFVLKEKKNKKRRDMLTFIVKLRFPLKSYNTLDDGTTKRVKRPTEAFQ